MIKMEEADHDESFLKEQWTLKKISMPLKQRYLSGRQSRNTMNYSGRVLDESFDGDFLKDALLNVPFDKPFRGPEIFSSGDYTYKSEITGDFEWFQGYEMILYKGKKIY